ncbi:MAG: hypothetical protein CSA36_01695 [Draconibacterium sp.]|nr:MAG: hypothetical protein CSA36_01695 [Draconibacterium sp.]
MKRIVMVRHAKAVPYGYDDDFNRDLRKRGLTDAEKLGEEMNKRQIKPDLIVASPAKRALKTASIFAKKLGYEIGKIVQKEDIYHGLSVSEFMEMINGLQNEASTVYFFGHNPSFHYFTVYLVEKFTGDMPTCSTVVIDFMVDSWKDVQPYAGAVQFQLIPKMFR